MSGEWLDSDLHRLYLIARLVDAAWTAPAEDLKTFTGAMTELRLHSAAFGLSPGDRARLRWEIDRGEEAQRNTEARRGPAPRRPDPRTASPSA